MQGLVLDGPCIVKRLFLYLCVWNGDDITGSDFEPFLVKVFNIGP